MEWQQLQVRPEYLTKKMQVRDLMYAFGQKNLKGKLNYIYDILIANGLVTRWNERYYLPTKKLLEFAFVPAMFNTSKEQRRTLVVNGHFTKEDVITIFGGGLKGETMFHALVRNGYMRQDDGRRYRITQELGERLADGLEMIPFVRVWETVEENFTREEVVDANSDDVQEVEEVVEEQVGLLPRPTN